MAWQPGRRRQALALEEPYEDVPAHLRGPLWEWIDRCLDEAPEDVMTRIGMHLRIGLPTAWGEARAALYGQSSGDPHFMLDLVEALLLLGVAPDAVEALGDLLRLANSAYRVNDRGDGLELVLVPGVKEVVQEAVDAAPGSAGEHLAAAWALAYGRTPDPVKAYSEAIKAAEAAAAPVVSPKNLKATLGTLIGEVRADPARWTCTVGGTDGAVEVQHLMSLLWQGQTSRHGGVIPTVPETPEAARLAVHVAATLVQAFAGGHVVRV